MHNEEAENARLAVDLAIINQIFRNEPDDSAGPEIELVEQDEGPNPEAYLTGEEGWIQAQKDTLSIQMLKKGVMSSENDPFINHMTHIKAMSARAMKFKEELVNGAIKVLEEGLVLAWKIEEVIPYSDQDLAFFYDKILECYEDGSQLGSAPTTTKKATWSWSVVFFSYTTRHDKIFSAQNGRVGRGRDLVVYLVVFWSFLVVFSGSQKKKEIEALIEVIREEKNTKNIAFLNQNERFKGLWNKHSKMLSTSSTTSEAQKESLQKMTIPSFVAPKVPLSLL